MFPIVSFFAITFLLIIALSEFCPITLKMFFDTHSFTHAIDIHRNQADFVTHTKCHTIYKATARSLRLQGQHGARHAQRSVAHCVAAHNGTASATGSGTPAGGGRSR